MQMRIAAFSNLAECVRHEPGPTLAVVGGVAVRVDHARDAVKFLAFPRRPSLGEDRRGPQRVSPRGPSANACG
eukprot:349585-Pyramimonas_sp.AAC.1